MSDEREAGSWQFTIAELAAEARREAALRRSVFPRWVTQGRLDQPTADRRIALMDAIANRLERQAGTPTQQRLF